MCCDESKGMPLEKSVKRLAIEVEDHALEFGDFEGEIPKGEYGAGTIDIWDKEIYKAKNGCQTLFF